MKSFGMKPLLTAAATALTLTTSLASPASADDQIHILGWLEHATIMSVDIRMDAKLFFLAQSVAAQNLGVNGRRGNARL